MHGRYWVPKNICFYIGFFVFALAGWAGPLLLYYYNPAIAAKFSRESIPFFDLNRPGNIGQWFISLLWLGIALFSLMMVFFVLSKAWLHYSDASLPREVNGISLNEITHYNGLARAAFWVFFCLLSVVMSADTVCRCTPLAYQWLLEKSSSQTADGGDRTFLTIVLLVAGGTAALFLFAAIRGYIRSFCRESRFCPKWGFRFTVVPLLLCLTFAVTVPKTESAADGAGSAVKAADSGEKSAPARSESGAAAKSDDGNAAESDYRTISYRREDSPAGRPELESIFGINVSFEKRFHLSKPVEEYVHLGKPIEDYLFGRLPELSLVQVQTFLRWGSYGLFIICLAGSLGLLARGERADYDMLIATVNARRPQGLACFQSPRMAKDAWKAAK
ncbi:MAG: hypothetical protein IJG60_03730 [Thermoguttaceae bacterium]|nr:hypothetical protein [Thermoguttaceae bacterium]